MVAQQRAPESEGFTGEVTGLGLSDFVQLEEQNLFSGCISVRQGAQAGRIFFRDGKVIHAEQGRLAGEEAFYELLGWRSGRFSLEHNVSTTSHTVHRSTQFLLLEAHRLMDERRAARPAARAEPAGPASPVDGARQTPGVVGAVLLDRDGACLDDGGGSGAALAGEGACLAVMATRIGARLGVGELRGALARSAGRELLIVPLGGAMLGALLGPGADPDAVARALVDLSPAGA